MATLAEIKVEEIRNPIHLLLIGPSKVGKTDYIADMLIDGFTVLYVDNDNGFNTLWNRIKNNEAAKARCHYVSTRNIWNFLVTFFARSKFQWNETKDEYFTASGSADDDKILEIYPKKIPFGVVIVFDSWTSITLQLLADAATKAGITIEDFKEGGQDAYGNANRRANAVCMNMQAYPGHMIVQAHEDFFERYEKPLGSQAEVKQKHMILREQKAIPMSVSRPHGNVMAKYFNEVGWMRVDRTGNFKLDFRQSSDKVGGGTMMKDGNPKDDHRFSKLTPVIPITDGEWIRTIPAIGLKEEAAQIAEERRLAAEKAKTDKAAGKGVTPTTTTAAAPRPMLAGKGLLGK